MSERKEKELGHCCGRRAGGAEGMEASAKGSEAQTFPLCVQLSGQIPRVIGPERSSKFPNLWNLSTQHCPSSLFWSNFNSGVKNAWTWGSVTTRSAQG